MASIAKLQQQYVANLKARAEKAEGEIERLRADIDKWIVKWADADASVTKLEAERDNLENVVEDFSSNIDHARELTHQLAARAEKAEAELARVRGDLEFTDGVHAITAKRAEKAQADLAQARKALVEMVEMMESGDEHGEGSEWYIRARAATGRTEGRLHNWGGGDVCTECGTTPFDLRRVDPCPSRTEGEQQ